MSPYRQLTDLLMCIKLIKIEGFLRSMITLGKNDKTFDDVCIAVHLNARNALNASACVNKTRKYTPPKCTLEDSRCNNRSIFGFAFSLDLPF